MPAFASDAEGYKYRDESIDLKEAKSRAQSKINGRAAGELRVVAINSKPAPDAQDRLRRLFTLLLEHTAGEREIPSGAEGDGLDKECGNGNGD